MSWKEKEEEPSKISWNEGKAFPEGCVAKSAIKRYKVQT